MKGEINMTLFYILILLITLFVYTWFIFTEQLFFWKIMGLYMILNAIIYMYAIIAKIIVT